MLALLEIHKVAPSLKGGAVLHLSVHVIRTLMFLDATLPQSLLVTYVHDVLDPLLEVLLGRLLLPDVRLGMFALHSKLGAIPTGFHACGPHILKIPEEYVVYSLLILGRSVLYCILPS